MEPQRRPNCHPSTAVEPHPQPAQGDTDTGFPRWRSCYDSHCCAALRDASWVPAACCRVMGPLAGPAPESPRVSHPPCLSTDGPDRENESALCFRLCTKLQPNRMPSSRERHSCLALCRRSSDENTILKRLDCDIWGVISYFKKQLFKIGRCNSKPLLCARGKVYFYWFTQNYIPLNTNIKQELVFLDVRGSSQKGTKSKII